MITGRKLGNKYELGAQIASGGMAEIVHATYRGGGDFKKEVCVKLIQSQFSNDPVFKRMFENEALIAARLQHANVVQVLDYDRDGNTCYIAMEYIFGKDLRSVMTRSAERGERIPLALCARIALDAARGLSVAHRLTAADGVPTPVIHRDVSPHNILVSFSGEVKITDFGIARLRAAASQTRLGTLKGKVNYMSPEQAAGTVLDVRSDVFSLGIVLWEMLAGTRLFDGDSELTVLEKVKNAPIPRPSNLARYVPPDLDAVVMQALERGPEDRFADAGVMADGLQKFLYSWTHDIEEESAALYLARVYPEEKRPTVREGTAVLDADDGGLAAPPPRQPVPAVPGEATASREGKKSGRRVAAVVAAVAVAAAASASAWYFSAQPQSPEPPAPQPAAASTPQASPLPPTVAPPPVKEATQDPPPAAEAGNACSPGTKGPACAPEPEPAPARPASGQQEPAKKTAKTVPRPQKTGTLTINARPWAHVYFKGNRLGTTPLSGIVLPEGEQKITLKNPELGVQKEIRVKIVAGEDHKASEDLSAGE